MKADVTVIGAGLAGSEAAWQLAEAGNRVHLLEMKRLQRTPAQQDDHLAELVCSNSLRSSNPKNAVGLLKEEMRRLGSLIIRAADAARVPAGDALAVDRDQFSAHVTAAIALHPRIELRDAVVDRLPGPADTPTVVATGPLTADALATEIGRLTGSERLYFYDAIAPIVASDSINRDVAYQASRYDKGEGADYLNCPLERDQYYAFVQALLGAACMPLHPFEEPRFFEGCMPIEVMAARGPDSLRFGPMKPIGLRDPRTGCGAFAVVQLRMEDIHGQALNIVGFQTKLTHPEQRRVFRLIPGLTQARFVRLGAVHRNTYIDSPNLLDDRMRLVSQPNIRFAGQVTGVEGYVESAASGLMTGLMLARDLFGTELSPPPLETALGALLAHIGGRNRVHSRPHEPQNINWAMFPPRPRTVHKRDAKQFRLLRARGSLALWAARCGIPLSAASVQSD